MSISLLQRLAVSCPGARRRLIVASCLCALALVPAACVQKTLPAKLAPWLEAKPKSSAEAPARSSESAAKKRPAPAEPALVQPGAPRPAPPQAAVPAAPAAATKGTELRAPPEAAGAIRVALLLPLSGTHGELGRALLDAAQIALFDLAGPQLELLPRDTQGTPEGALAAVDGALEQGAQLILGPLFSTSVAAVANPARERGVNLLAFSNDRTVAGRGVYLLGFMPDQQVERVVRYAADQGIWRFAALTPESAYGTTLVESLRHTSLRHGGTVVQVESYPEAAEEFFEPVQRLANYSRRYQALQAEKARLKARDDDDAKIALGRIEGADTLGELEFQAVLMGEGGERLKAIAPLLPFYDIDPGKVRFLGTGLWDNPTIGREPALVGGWFASPEPAAAAAFGERFKATYGYAAPRIASLAYDATALAAVLALGESGVDFSARALEAPSGFAGIDGIFRFGPDGLARRGLAVIEIRPQGLKVIDPAPTSFQAAGSS